MDASLTSAGLTTSLCILCLAVTGYIIGKPFTLAHSTEAYQQCWFGTVRFIHFVSAFVFFFNFLFRIYWGFVGKEYASWSNFIPNRASQLRELRDVLRGDILQTRIRGPIALGHNSLAGFIYFLTFLVFLFQSMTGFALYSALSTSFLPGLFAWVVPHTGEDFAVRQWHHMAMWFFIVFAIIHVYPVFYHNYVEGRATTSSIVGGWKFERNEEVNEK